MSDNSRSADASEGDVLPNRAFWRCCDSNPDLTAVGCWLRCVARTRRWSRAQLVLMAEVVDERHLQRLFDGTHNERPGQDFVSAMANALGRQIANSRDLLNWTPITFAEQLTLNAAYMTDVELDLRRRQPRLVGTAASGGSF